jgi:hypothetical protein
MDGEEHATPGQDGLPSRTIQRKEEENMSTEENKKIVIVDGKVVEQWVEADMLGLLQ